MGGIDLDTIEANKTRVNDLCTFLGITPQDVCLLSNSNNTFWTPYEVKAWTGAKPFIDAPDPSPGDPNPFVKAFKDFDQTGKKALVVGGAPSLQERKDALKFEAKKYKKHVCYAFHAYREGSVPPQDGYYTVYGPMLGTEYYNLGVKVGELLASTNPGPSGVTKADMGKPYPRPPLWKKYLEKIFSQRRA